MDGEWLDEDERHDEIDRTEIDAAAAGLDEQVDEEEHFDLGSGSDGGGGETDLSGPPAVSYTHLTLPTKRIV